jgi:hypothetical protein
MTFQEIVNWHLMQVRELWRDQDSTERDFHYDIAKELIRIERKLEKK